MRAVNEVFGVGGHPAIRSVADYGCRQTEVLFLYPLDLVAVDERFGSWVVQYGYANSITADKLVQRGEVTAEGQMAVGDARYRAICALYEPFPSRLLVELLTAFVEAGGTLIWSGVPALREREGRSLPHAWWRELFGIELTTTRDPLGQPLPARQITFGGALAGVAPMSILTDMVVDRVCPLRALSGTETVATLRKGGASHPLCVGTRKLHPQGGQALYLGFRPRDDQAASTGKEVRTWFEILHAAGAYPGSGLFAAQDNPSVISRSSEYVASSFPNGAVAICLHYRHHEESWPGGFFRDEELDARIMQENPLPPDDINLVDWPVAGQLLRFRGQHAVTWRCDEDSNLVAFAGFGCTGIGLDSRQWSWSDEPVDIAWHPLSSEQATDDYEPLYRIWCGSTGSVRLPLGLDGTADLEVWLGAYHPVADRRWDAVRGRVGIGERRLTFRLDDGALLLDVDESTRGHWFYVVKGFDQSSC
ncbi:MAG: hypothetical protein U9R25_19740 [Chloroflexota bacterium]|nr:hypothetical protein [Chloroflexota bacterium]